MYSRPLFDSAQWKKEVTKVLPESMIDQFEAASPNDFEKQLRLAHDWVKDNPDAEYLWDLDHKQWKSYLSESLKIPPGTFIYARAKSTDTKGQIIAVLLWYLEQKLKDLQGSNYAAGKDQGIEKIKHTMTKPDKEDDRTYVRPTSELSPSHIQGISLSPQPISIKKYDLPRPAFQETESYRTTLDMVRSAKENKVVHIYGISGNGKSQIVRRVCKAIDDKCMPHIIWHTQCAEGSDILKSDWRKLITKLEKAEIISSMDADRVLSDMEEGSVRSFSQKLQELCFPVLLVIEDVAKCEVKMLQEVILTLLDKNHNKLHSNIVQLLIATQKLEAIFTKMDLSSIISYFPNKITGFTTEEAEKFLLTPTVNHMHENRDAVSKLASALAYSPLHLTQAKSYCEKYEEEYESYYRSLGKDVQIIEKEKRMLSDHPELGTAHAYEVTMKLVKSQRQDEEDHLELKIIQMMSFLNNEDIPDILLGRFAQELNHVEVTEERRIIKHLLTRMETDCLVDVLNLSEDRAYGCGLVSTHIVIFYAVSLSMSEKEGRETIISVLHAISSLVSKDNRVRDNSDILFVMRKHVDRVVRTASELLRCDFDIKHPRMEDFEIQISLSWLYEVLGFVSTQYQALSDHNYEKALIYLWGFCTSDIFIGWRKTKVKKDLFVYETEKDPKLTAKEADKAIKKVCEKIPQEFVVQHYSKFFPINIDFLKGMKETLGNEKVIKWDEMELKLRQDRCLSEDHITVLRENKMILTAKQLRRVFLSERIASVLHSRGRQVLYIQNAASEFDQRRFEWYAAVGLEMMKILASRERDFHSLFEYIIQANSMLPRMLQDRPNESDNEFVQRLRRAKKLAESLKNPEGCFYENGMYKVVAGTPYTVLNAMKYVIKANSKLWKRPKVAQNNPFPDALTECQSFYEHAKKHRKFVMAAHCRVKVGKYYAAVGMFETALEAFESSFDYKGEGMNKHIENRPNDYAWAVFNFGRALFEGRDLLPVQTFSFHKERFDNRYNSALRQEISKDWRQKLDEYKVKLQNNNTSSKPLNSSGI